MMQIRKIAWSLIVAVGLGMGQVSLMAQEVSVIELAEDVPIRVIVDNINYIDKEGKLSNIIIEERAVGCLTREKLKADRTLVLSLQGTSYSFSKLPVVKMGAGFSGLKTKVVSYGKTDGDVDTQLVYITLPRDTKPKSKGRLTISGLEVESDSSGEGDLEMAFGLLSSEELTAIEVSQAAEYGIQLSTKKIAHVIAGDSEFVNFSVTENMPDSITSNGTLEISLDQGYFRKMRNNELEIDAVLLDGVDITKKVSIEPEYEEDKIMAFDIQLPNLNSTKRHTLTFKGLLLGANTTDLGAVNLTVGGRGVPEEQSMVLAEIKSGSDLSIQKIDGIVGRNNQKGGAVFITESSKGMINKGIIEIKIEGSPYILMSKKPTVEVVNGDAKVVLLGWDKKNDNLLRLKITKASTKASTIKISGFNFSINKIAPDGSYGIDIGGSALYPESHGERQHFDDFITVSEEEASTW